MIPAGNNHGSVWRKLDTYRPIPCIVRKGRKHSTLGRARSTLRLRKMSDCWFSKKSPNILTNHGLGAQVGERRRGLEYQPPRQIRILKPRIVEICKRFSGGAGRLGWVGLWGGECYFRMLINLRRNKSRRFSQTFCSGLGGRANRAIIIGTHHS